jgi:5-methylcytosine-specific restriction endonuclease McrA
MNYKDRRKIIGKFYKSKEWENVRKYCLMRDNYLCQHCGRPASDVHHIKHLTEDNIWDPSIALNPDNLVSLCWKCHRDEHKADDGMGRLSQESNPYTFDANGYLVEKAK